MKVKRAVGGPMQPSAVSAYSSFAYAVAPRTFTLGTAAHRVCEVTRVWRTEGHLHFYVRDERDELFELRYDETGDVWAVRAFGASCPPRAVTPS